MKALCLGLIGVGLVGCAGDDDACREADEVAEEIRVAAQADHIVAPCAMSADAKAGLSAERAAYYERACARYLALADECEG